MFDGLFCQFFVTGVQALGGHVSHYMDLHLEHRPRGHRPHPYLFT